MTHKHPKFLFLFLTVLIFFLFENYFFENIIERIYNLNNLKGYLITGYYGFVTILGFIGIGSLLFIRNTYIFSISFFLLMICYAVDLIYKGINGVGFTLNDLNIIQLEGNGMFMQAVSTYYYSIIHSFIILFILGLILVGIRRFIKIKKFFFPLRWIIILNSIALSLSYSIVYKTVGSTQARPTSFKLLTTTIYYFSNKLYYGERENFSKKPSFDSDFDNIILIVDESVGGHYLSINGCTYDTTPYLKSIENSFINLGIASSGANCSSSSNLILMSGIQFNELPDTKYKSLKKPTIFQFAKNAGYKTHYLFGQGLGHNLLNYITTYDLEYIDNYFQPAKYKHQSMPEEDLIVETKKVLHNSNKNFIFMVKHGCHFPWENDYPKNESVFKPTLNSDEPLSLVVKDKAINSYLNSVKYNVDDFFKSLLKEINFDNSKKTLIIYTSDHGQSILENGRSSTHCDSNNPPKTQGIVPFIIFTSRDDTVFNKSKFKKNIYSHYQIAPTIKKVMGYRDLNEQTIFDINKKNSSQKFISGDIFGRSTFQENDINR